MSSYRRVLFVDDEPQVLSGLRRMLAPYRDEWHTEFVDSGREALTRLDEDQFDVVVSDMRMPEMSGAELLEQIATRHPGVARIILSGAASESELMLSARSAHQFLAKPCDRHLLESVVNRALALHEFLDQPELVDLVSSLSSLPTFPTVAADILRELRSEDPSLARLADIVAHDVALAAKLLQLVNSSFFGLSRQIADPREAVRLVGAARVSALSLGVGLYTNIPPGAAAYSFDRLWRRSTTVADGAAAVAASLGAPPDKANLAYMGGLLSVAGTLILASHHTERYLRAASNPSQVASEDAVAAEFGATAAQLGAYVLGLWGLPATVVEAVAFHRSPSVVGVTDNTTTLAAVHVANALVEAEATGAGPELDWGFLDGTGIGDRVDGFRELCCGGETP